MKNLKIFLSIVLIATILVVASTVSFATDGPTFLPITDEGNNNVVNATTNTETNTSANNVFDNSTNNVLTNDTVNNITTNNTVNNTANNTVNDTTNNTNSNSTNNTSSYNNTDLPKAGSGDSIVIIAIIAVLGISAIYAYKKIRDYNVK